MHFYFTACFRWLFLLAIFCSIAAGEKAPTPYPKDYFQSPVGHDINLSGSFGELRPNHFHAGVDIKSASGQSGEPIYAAAEGFVSRIKVDASGYGNALYIQHPNGFTTVYAHLLRYNTEIQAYVRQQQYAKQSFNLDISFKEPTFSVNRGTEIGKLGNTGSSGGPHLHFEIRDTKTEETINPLLFGMSIRDEVAPTMHALRVYSLAPDRQTTDAKTLWLEKTSTKNVYRLPGDTVTVGAWRTGFALRSFDGTNGNSNQNGLYRLTMYVDGVLAYKFEMERFSFDDTRFCNAHEDYELETKKDMTFNRCYVLPGNRLPLYSRTDLDVVDLHQDVPRKITMIAEDVYGNASQLEFWVKQSEVMTPPVTKPYHYQLLWDKENAIKTGSMSLFFPKGALYENLNMTYVSLDDRSKDIFSVVHRLHETSVPIHASFEIGITPNSLPEEFRKNAFIGRCTPGRPLTNCGGTWEGNQLVTKANEFGDYCVMVDTVRPYITARSFAPDMRKSEKISFSISDNLRVRGSSFGLTYKAYVDDVFILFDYDQKSGIISYTFDERVSSGDHTLRLVLTDAVGNTQTWERPFKR